MNVTTLLLKRHHRLAASVAVAMWLLLLTLPIAQALTFDSPIRMTTNTGISRYPSVADNGSYVYIAWEDWTPVTGSGTASAEIWMRASINNGRLFGSPVRISTNTGYSTYPSVAAAGSHVYVAWMDTTSVPGSGDSNEIWMRASSNNGGSFGSPIRITTNTYASNYPSVAAVGSHVYVAWMDSTPVTGSGGSWEVWIRASSNYGAVFGPAVRITTNTGNSGHPSVAASGSHVYIAWHDDTAVSGAGLKPEIYMRVSPNYGASFGSAIRLTTNTGSSAYPSVAAVGSHVYVAWEDDTSVTGSGDKDEIWMRASSNNGGSFGSAIRISTNKYNSDVPSVAAVGSYVYVAWDDDTPVPGSNYAYEVWMRVSSNNGASFGSAIRITTNTGGSNFPRVSAEVYNVNVAWWDETPVTGSGGNPEIWTRVGS